MFQIQWCDWHWLIRQINLIVKIPLMIRQQKPETSHGVLTKRMVGVKPNSTLGKGLGKLIWERTYLIHTLKTLHPKSGLSSVIKRQRSLAVIA